MKKHTSAVHNISKLRRKKGISQVVTTTIIILVVIVAIGIIAAIFLAFFRTQTTKFQEQAVCPSIIIRLTSVEKTIDENGNGAYKITLRREGGEDSISKIDLLFDGQYSVIKDISLVAFETKDVFVSFSEVPAINGNAQRVRAAAVIGSTICEPTGDGNFVLEQAVVGDDGVDLKITKSATSSQSAYNTPFTYTILVENQAPNTAGNVQLTDTFLSEGVAIIPNVGNNCFGNGNSLICDIGPIEGGAVKEIKIMVEFSSSLNGQIVNNTAEVTTSSRDVNPDNNMASYAVTVLRGGGSGGGGGESGDGLPEECSDSLDNDNDGYIDSSDPECQSCPLIFPVQLAISSWSVETVDFAVQFSPLVTQPQEVYNITLKRGFDSGPAGIGADFIFKNDSTMLLLDFNTLLANFGVAIQDINEDDLLNEDEEITIQIPTSWINITQTTEIEVMPNPSGLTLCDITGLIDETGGECSAAQSWLSVANATNNTISISSTAALSPINIVFRYYNITVSRVSGGPDRNVYYNFIFMNNNTGESQSLTAQELLSQYASANIASRGFFGLREGQKKSAPMLYEWVNNISATHAQIIPLLNGQACEEAIPPFPGFDIKMGRAEAIILGNIIKNSGFENWSAGTNNNPDNWGRGFNYTGGGSLVSQESAIVQSGLYSAKYTKQITALSPPASGLAWTGPMQSILTPPGAYSVSAWVYVPDNPAIAAVTLQISNRTNVNAQRLPLAHTTTRGSWTQMQATFNSENYTDGFRVIIMLWRNETISPAPATDPVMYVDDVEVQRIFPVSITNPASCPAGAPLNDPSCNIAAGEICWDRYCIPRSG